MTRNLLSLCSLVAIAIALGLSSECHAETITVDLPKVEANAEGKIDVVLNLEGAKNMVAWQLVVVHDPAVLKVAEVESGKVLEESNGLLETNSDNPGRTWVASASIQPIAGDGELLRISYDVIGEVGDKSPLTIEKAAAWQANEMEILVESNDGSVTIGNAASGLPWLWILVGLLISVVVALGVMLFRRKPVASLLPQMA